MHFIEELDGIAYSMGGPGIRMQIFVYFDKYHSVTLEDFNNGEFLESFIELEGSSIDKRLKMQCSDLKAQIEHYIEAEDLYLILPSGEKIPQIEVEYQYDI